jgi:hypothetical protein
MLTNKRGTMLRVCDAARSGLAVPRLKNIVASPSRAVAALKTSSNSGLNSVTLRADFVGRDCGISGQDQD